MVGTIKFQVMNAVITSLNWLQSVAFILYKLKHLSN